MVNTLASCAARPERRTRLLRLAWSLLMAAWLSACGPGVGGTGTGETGTGQTNGLAHFGATAVSVCSADVGSLLGCAPAAGAVTPTPTPVPGAAPVFLADAVANPRVQARVQDSAIDLTVACTGLRFRGQWGELAGQAPRFFGSTGPDGAQTPATLQVQPAAAGAVAVVVTLRDAGGSIVMGPTLLLVVSSAVAPGSCS